MSIANDVSFLLSHFDTNYLFPRKMMTSISNGQFTVGSKMEITDRCEESKLRDCRLNAFPVFTGYKGIVMQPPDFVFVDLDLSNFSTANEPKEALDLALRKTLKNMTIYFQEPSQHSQHSSISTGLGDQPLGLNKAEETDEIKPTVLWTGNGYHVYLPIKAIVLDKHDVFSPAIYPNLFAPLKGAKFMGWSVSELFLKFCSVFFSSGKADPQHSPKFKTCLVRIPNTLNSKCLLNGLTEPESAVRIIQEWNGYRPPIQLITKYFRRWLLQEELKQRRRGKLTSKKTVHYSRSQADMIPWIEKLLKTPLEDKRKFCLFQILVPYLSNVRRLPMESSICLIETWLDICKRERAIDFRPQTIRNYFKNVKEYLPISRDKLRLEHAELYRELDSRGIFHGIVIS